MVTTVKAGQRAQLAGRGAPAADGPRGATADPVSVFVGWAGADCPGTAPCTLSIEGAVQVEAAFARRATLEYKNLAPIAILDFSPAAPYPSLIVVPPEVPARVVSHATVTLHAVSHSFVSDIDVLLRGPGGQTAVLASGAGGSEIAALAVPPAGRGRLFAPIPGG